MPAPDNFISAYMQTALWSSNDESDESGGVPFDQNFDWRELPSETVAAMTRDCNRFYDANRETLNCEGVTFGPDFDQDGRAGHDFWLTRNHHGAGFWDGDWPEPQATALTTAAHAFGECDLILGDDGQIYVA